MHVFATIVAQPTYLYAPPPVYHADKVAVHLYPHSQNLTKTTGAVVVNPELNSSLVLM